MGGNPSVGVPSTGGGPSFRFVPRRRQAKRVVMTATPGSFEWTGTDADLRVTRGSKAASGAFRATESERSQFVARRQRAASGEFELFGTPAALAAHHVFAAKSGSVECVGSSADFEYVAGWSGFRVAQSINGVEPFRVQRKGFRVK